MAQSLLLRDYKKAVETFAELNKNATPDSREALLGLILANTALTVSLFLGNNPDAPVAPLLSLFMPVLQLSSGFTVLEEVLRVLEHDQSELASECLDTFRAVQAVIAPN